MKILVINAGSSSLKYQLIDMSSDEVLAKGLVERIGIEGSKIKQTSNAGKVFEAVTVMDNHEDAVEMVKKALLDKEYGVIDSMDQISAVGHRVVHGGEFSAPRF